MNATASIVSKVWSFCTTLRDDGVGYGDYLEQLTYLIFLKMADEYSQPPYNRKVGIPAEYDWQKLRFEDLQDFIACYNPLNRHKRKEVWEPTKQPGRTLAQVQLRADQRARQDQPGYFLVE